MKIRLLVSCVLMDTEQSGEALRAVSNIGAQQTFVDIIRVFIVHQEVLARISTSSRTSEVKCSVCVKHIDLLMVVFMLDRLIFISNHMSRLSQEMI